MEVVIGGISLDWKLGIAEGTCAAMEGAVDGQIEPSFNIEGDSD